MGEIWWDKLEIMGGGLLGACQRIFVKKSVIA